MLEPKTREIIQFLAESSQTYWFQESDIQQAHIHRCMHLLLTADPVNAVAALFFFPTNKGEERYAALLMHEAREINRRPFGVNERFLANLPIVGHRISSIQELSERADAFAREVLAFLAEARRQKLL